MPNQLAAGGDVAPLIAAAHLQPAAEAIVQHEVVVGLQQLVAELGERDAIVAAETPLHRFLRHHVVHGEVLADVAEEIEEADRAQPVDVVGHARGVARRLEVEKAFELRADALRVGFDLLERQQVALRRSCRWDRR